MKIKFKNSLTLAVILVFFCIVFYFVNLFTGNPVSAYIAAHKIRNYTTDTYPKMDFKLSKVRYNLKNSSYGCYAQSKTSEDTRFYIGYSHDKVTDDFKNEVANKFTTYRRLSKDFHNLVEDTIEKDYPHETTMVLGDLIGDTNLLTLDMPFELNKIPLPTSLTVQVLSEDRSVEKMASLLLELHQLMQNKSISIDQYSICLEEPLSEEEKPGSGDNNYLTDFPAKNITENNDSLASEIRAFQKDSNKDEK